MQEILKVCPEMVEFVASAMKPVLFRNSGRKVGQVTEYERGVTRDLARSAIEAITAWNQRIGR